MDKTVVRSSDGRKFVIVVDGREVFVGTIGMISNIAAQMICHEAMKNSGLKPLGCCRDLELDGNHVIGVGYKIPLFMRKPMKKVGQSINSYSNK